MQIHFGAFTWDNKHQHVVLVFEQTVTKIIKSTAD